MIKLTDLLFEGRRWAVVATADRGAVKKGQILAKNKSQAQANRKAYEIETQAGIPAAVREAPGTKVGDFVSEGAKMERLAGRYGGEPDFAVADPGNKDVGSEVQMTSKKGGKNRGKGQTAAPRSKHYVNERELTEAKDVKLLVTIDGTDSVGLFLQDVRSELKHYKGSKIKFKREHGFYMMDYEITIPDAGDIWASRDIDQLEKFLGRQGAKVKRLSEVVADAKEDVTPEESEEMEAKLKKDVNFTTHSPKMFESISEMNDLELLIYTQVKDKIIDTDAGQVIWGNAQRMFNTGANVRQVIAQVKKDIAAEILHTEQRSADEAQFSPTNFPTPSVDDINETEKGIAKLDELLKRTNLREIEEPIDTYKGWKIFTLGQYTTPYYYPEQRNIKGRKVGGSVDHYPRIKKIHQLIDKWLKQMGKSSLKEFDARPDSSKSISTSAQTRLTTVANKKQDPKPLKEEAGIMGLEAAQELAMRIKKEVVAPVVSAKVATLGGKERPSVMVTISLDPKNTWKNGIYHNSRYSIWSVDYNGVIEQIGRAHTIRLNFRKARFKTPNEVIVRLNDYIQKVNRL